LRFLCFFGSGEQRRGGQKSHQQDAPPTAIDCGQANPFHGANRSA
jgi:hypothetical protein